MFAVWTAGTWFYEGRIQTLLRPDAVADRLIYALVVNLCVGIVGSLLLLGWLRGRSALPIPERSGFGTWKRVLPSVVIGFAIGLGIYVAQGAPSKDPVVVTNAFAQVFVVSVAEVVVCWALVGSAVEAALRTRVGWLGTPSAALISAALFGVYHFAHSAPFNTWSMVGLLTVVGLVTGAFFFISRDVLGTAVFHNFLGTFGVTQALADNDALASLEALQLPLIGTALATTAVMVLGYWWVRRGRRTVLVDRPPLRP